MTADFDAPPDWARALGAALFPARIRVRPGEFRVEEVLPFDPGHAGAHDLLLIEKTGANTAWVARRLARFAGVRISDVGYAGLKDRNAVTRQWFSVPRRPGGVDWTSFSADGVTVIERRGNNRKLRRGMHRANRFRIAMRTDSALPDARAIAQRVRMIEARGVPNYFGLQRFGHGFGNLRLARRLFSGAGLSRDERGFAISAARALLFNEILAARVAAGTWDRMLAGDIANLDGTGSVFQVEVVDTLIESRCEGMDIHPTGTLWGLRSPLSRMEAARVERDATRIHADLTSGLEAIEAEADTRALRLRVHELSWEIDDGALWLSFMLPKGGFATAVLREIADATDG